MKDDLTPEGISTHPIHLEIIGPNKQKNLTHDPDKQSDKPGIWKVSQKIQHMKNQSPEGVKDIDDSKRVSYHVLYIEKLQTDER